MSYSQAGEDRVLIDNYFARLYPDGGVYVEVGAMDGVRYSNTKLLEESHGWTGILIEPHPLNFDLLQKNRPGNRLYNALLGTPGRKLRYTYFENANLAAVSGVATTFPARLREKFYESDDEWISMQRARTLRETEMCATGLSELIRDSGFDHIHFFSLDVEGHEHIVLDSYEWDFEIDFILVEANSGLVHECLERRGYVFLREVAHNRLYVSGAKLPDVSSPSTPE